MKITDNSSQRTRALVFKALHERSGAFIIPNPWDAGSAKLLEGIGFEALATTSAGLAFSLGKPDGVGAVTRDEALQNAKAIISSTRLPVAADLENGYGDDPEACAQTILRAAEAGLVGGSMEDATGKEDDPIYSFDLSLERVKASVAAARSLPFPFMLTARAENLLHGRMDLQDTLKRLEAFADAGADVLFAPGLTRADDIAAAVKVVSPKPLNVIMGLSDSKLTVQGLSDLGVKRISLGSSLARAAFSSLIHASEEVFQKGTFTFSKDSIPYSKLNGLFKTLTR